MANKKRKNTVGTSTRSTYISIQGNSSKANHCGCAEKKTNIIFSSVINVDKIICYYPGPDFNAKFIFFRLILDSALGVHIAFRVTSVSKLQI